MDDKTFGECFDYLKRFHKLEPSATVREAWWIAFEKEHDEVFCKAMMLHNAKQAPGRFPTIERFKGYVTDAREKAWEGKKAAEPRRPLANYQPRAGDFRNQERGRRWITGIIAVCEGKISADDLIAEMREGHDG